MRENRKERQMLLLINRHLLLAFLIVFLMAFYAPNLNVDAANKEISFVERASNGRFISMNDAASREPVIDLQFQSAFDTMPILGCVVSNIGIAGTPNRQPVLFENIGYIAFAHAKQFANAICAQHLGFIEMDDHSGIGVSPSFSASCFPIERSIFGKYAIIFQQGGVL